MVRKIFELFVVGTALIVLAITINVISQAAHVLWTNSQGLLYAVLVLVADPFGGNLDISVALLTGILTGLFILFMFDGTKRVQVLFVLICGGVGSLLPLLIETDRILDAVSKKPVLFIIGFLIGISAGIVTTYRYSNLYPVDFRSGMGFRESIRWIQFPTATKGFFWISSVIVVITGFNYTMSGLTVFESLGTLMATFGFILSLVVFTQYEYQKDIVSVSPPDHEVGKYHPYIIGGLYEYARQDYHAMPSTGTIDSELANARGVAVGSINDLPRIFNSKIKFAIVWPIFGGWSVKKIIIESENWATTALSGIDDRYGGMELSSTPIYRILRWIRHYFRLAIPQIQPGNTGIRQSDIISRIDHADTVLLIVSTPSDTDDIPEEVREIFGTLCDRYKDPLSTDVVIATTEAQQIATQENLDFDGDRFISRCKHRLGVRGKNCTLVPVDRFHHDGIEVGGFDVLLEEIVD